MQLPYLIQLTHRRWNVPLLAFFQQQPEAKFVTLAHALGCSRSALSASLQSLIALGLVRRNTGYGHPLRPEYLLDPKAEAVASICAGVHHKVEAWQLQDLAYRKWSLPLVLATGLVERRFAELRQQLAPITARALAISLKDLEQQRWLSRSVTDQYPPETRYALGRPGRILHQLVQSGGISDPPDVQVNRA